MEPQTPAAKSLAGACKIFRQDLEALPEDAYCKQFGPATRTVADIVFEVNMVNDHVSMEIRGEKPFEWPEDGWVKAPTDFNTKAIVLDAFNKSAQAAMDTANGLTAEQMEEPMTKDDGSPTTRAERCRFMGLHMWYHSGQLNFIQTLLGDDAWHWN
ncbi:MAG: DinB family protein [Armatimonadetes bacterium]|nr:DinB family protein [Armatimonadota bacterium]